MYLQVEESLFEAGHDGCVLVVRVEGHIGVCLVCEKMAVVLDRVLGWMDDDVRRPRPIKVWGLGHELLSSLSHASPNSFSVILSISISCHRWFARLE